MRTVFQKIKEKKIPTALLTFGMGMAVLTIAARMADNFMLPVVTVDGFTQMALEYPVQITGRIESEGSAVMYARENLRVGSVEAEEGDFIKKGDILFTYDMAFLDEKIEDMEKELTKQELRYEDTKNKIQLAADNRKKSISRANRDYKDALNASGALEAAAYQDMMAAKQKYESICQNPPEEVTVCAPVFSDGSEFDDGTDNGENGQDAAKADARTQWEAEKESHYLDYIMKKRSYNEIQRSAMESRKNAGRQAEDAQEPLSADSSRKLQELDLADVEEDLRELLSVKETGGKVLAETDGKVKRINVSAGGITGTDAAVVLEDFSRPFRFEGIADARTAENLFPGMLCNLTLKESKKFIGNQKIHKVTELINEDSGMEDSEKNAGENHCRIVVKIDSPDVKKSGSAKLETVSESRYYRYCIPLNAVHESGNESYIYVAENRATILGMETIAVRVPVRILEKNETYAAVEGGFREGADVISAAGKGITDGERVKVLKSV